MSLKLSLRLLKLMRPYWGAMLLGALLSLITLLANIGLLAVSGWFIASMALAGISGAAINYFTPAALIRALAIVRTVGRYAERLVSHNATLALLSELRSWFYQRLEPLAPARLQQYHSGDLFSRIRADIDTLDHFYLRVLTPFSVALLALLIVFTVLWFYHWQLASMALLLWLSVGLLLPWWLYRCAQPLAQQQVQEAERLRRLLLESLQGMAELSLFNRSAERREALAQSSAELNRTQLRQARLTAWSQSGLLLAANLALWGALWLLIPLRQSELIEAVEFPMLLLLLLASFEAVMPLPLAMQALAESLAAARRLFEIVDAQPQVAEGGDERALSAEPRLLLEKLRMGYEADARPVLDELSFSLQRGESLVLLGESGAGKSSLINVLLRFWEYQGGSVSLDGVELKDLPAEQVRSQFAVVSQRSHLFNASVRQNLLLANPEASEAELIEVCRQTQIDEFIQSLPEGYDTLLGEAAVRLSGGEARRLVIARALLKPAPFLILDEPTEGLDGETEQQLMRTLVPLFQQRGVILITHRLIGLEQFDRIVLLERGRVVESGSHQELIEKKGRYLALLDGVGGM